MHILKSKQVGFCVYVIILLIIITQNIFSDNSFKSGQSSQLNSDVTNLQMTKSITSMPLAFTENQGQWDEKVKFRANAGGATMWFSSDGAYYQFTRTIEKKEYSIVDKRYGMMPDDMMDRQPDSVETMMIKAHFMGSNANPQMVGVDMMEYKCNYFIGNDPNEWHTDVPNYSAVLYEQVYDGIDLKYYGNGKQMEYDFIVEPGADYSQIKIQYEGAESISVNDKGELVVNTMWGEVIEQKPIIYQIVNNSRIPVTGKYSLKGNNSFGFELSNYDKSKPLVIDPVLVYSTYLGGSDSDKPGDIVVDNLGCAYITGLTWSNNFPTQGSYQTFHQGGIYDAFVTKINNFGSGLVYSTYLGGSNDDIITNIAVDESNNAYIVGYTNSTDFPMVGEIQTYQAGNEFDVIVTKLNSSGNGLVYSTCLGGKRDDKGYGIAVDELGIVYVTGTTRSLDYPILNPYQDSFAGSIDIFITKISVFGDSLIYSTYLGGNSIDFCKSIAVDDFGSAYVTGYTQSSNFPTINAYQPYQENTNAFITKLNSLGDSIVFSTYLGGSLNDFGSEIVLDKSGALYVTGYTSSLDFPLLHHFQTLQGTWDAFVSKFSTAGDSMIYSTCLGGNLQDYGYNIDVDAFGSAYVTGVTFSGDYPTLDSYQNLYSGDGDIFLTKLSSFGNNLIYSTYLGGSGRDDGSNIVVDASGAVYITGSTESTDFPTLNPYQGTNQGSKDVFVCKFNFDNVTDIEELEPDNLPADYNMSQNYPNPFNPTTTIEFDLPKKSHVSISIYNLLGQKIKSLGDNEYSAGNHQLTWDGTSSSGVKVSTGIYFYRLETDGFIDSKKMILLK